MIPSFSSLRSRAVRMFGAMPRTRSWSSPYRKGPGRSAATITSDQRSPRRSATCATCVSSSARSSAGRSRLRIGARMASRRGSDDLRVARDGHPRGGLEKLRNVCIVTCMSQVTTLVNQVGPGVVGVRWGRRRASGVVVAQDRVVVLRQARPGPVEVAVAGQSPQAGEPVGSDRRRGLAVLAAPTGDVAAAPWADAPPHIGDAVFALANPGGTGLRATEGRVSSEPLTVRGRHGGPVEGVIEHTAPLPRGANGGPLVDSAGALLGLNVLRSDPGLILALPAAVVRPVVERILGGREQDRHLGVALAPRRASRKMRAAVGLPERDGLIVRGVEQRRPSGYGRRPSRGPPGHDRRDRVERG